MNLTKVQPGENEYVKAYYDALLKKQQELEEAVTKQREFSNAPISDALSGMPSNRQVGMKSKRDDDEGDNDVD
ncbi:hypothetical protein Q3G72_025732 [Acer saccharum]|nr:hypothetical protein Q3G72_025732 [Acer saccharum]